jgi:hypothetical protein
MIVYENEVSGNKKGIDKKERKRERKWKRRPKSTRTTETRRKLTLTNNV